MTEAIRAWLNGSRKFDEGVKLYLIHGRDTAFKLLLQRGETSTVKSRLFQELKALISSKDAKNVIKVAKYVTEVAKNEIISPENEIIAPNPIAIQAKREAELLYKQLMDVRSRLFSLCPLEEDSLENNAGTVQVRAQLAAEVIRLQYLMDEAYAAFRYAQIHGKMPETKTEPPVVDPVRLHQEISNLRKNISWYRRKKEPTAKDLSALQEKEIRLETLLKQYEDAVRPS
jgi:hypothetical protein